MASLPYRAVTSSGTVIDVRFALHPETVSARRVGDLLTGILGALDAQIEGQSATANGDVLQAIAMALALRAGMLPASPEMRAQLAHGVLDLALASLDGAVTTPGSTGRA